MYALCARGRGVCVCVRWGDRGSSTGKAGEIRKEEREFACEIQGLGGPVGDSGSVQNVCDFS